MDCCFCQVFSSLCFSTMCFLHSNCTLSLRERRCKVSFKASPQKRKHNIFSSYPENVASSWTCFVAAVQFPLISISPRQITHTTGFTHVKKSSALKPLEQDLKTSVPPLQREQQFILIWLGSGCLWSCLETRSSLQMLWMISYVVGILHVVRRDEHHSPFWNEKKLNLFKDEKLHLLATFCFLALPAAEDGCIKVLSKSELILKASKTNLPWTFSLGGHPVTLVHLLSLSAANNLGWQINWIRYIAINFS